MSREDYIAVASRLFSIYLLYSLISAFTDFVVAIRQQPDMTIGVSYVLMLAVGSALCVLTWFFPLTIARKLLPVMREARSEETIGAPTALSLGLTLLGMWFLCKALIDASYWGSLVFGISRTVDVHFNWTTEQIASMVATVVEFLVAFCLLFGASGIRRLIYRYRYGSSHDAP